MRVNKEDRENGAFALRFLCYLMFKFRRVILREPWRPKNLRCANGDPSPRITKVQDD